MPHRPGRAARAAAASRRRRADLDPGGHVTRASVRASVSSSRPLIEAVSDADVSGGWTPHVWLGAPAPGGLALPAASPTMSWMYSPRGVFFDAERLVVADSGNHRVLIWHDLPSCD